MSVISQTSCFTIGCFANTSSQFTNVQKSVCKRYKHLIYAKKSVHTLCRFEMSSFSRANKLTFQLKSYSLVVDFVLSQRQHVACTVAVIFKSIYQYETGLAVVVFQQEALLFKGRSTTTETWDKNCPFDYEIYFSMK